MFLPFWRPVLLMTCHTVRTTEQSKGAKPFSVSGGVTTSHLTPTVLSSHVDMQERDEITGGSANEGWLQIRENKCGINLRFPEGTVTHCSTYIDKCIAYHQNVFVLVNKCCSQVNCDYSIHFSTMPVIDVLHTYTHHIRLEIDLL